MYIGVWLMQPIRRPEGSTLLTNFSCQVKTTAYLIKLQLIVLRSRGFHDMKDFMVDDGLYIKGENRISFIRESFSIVKILDKTQKNETQKYLNLIKLVNI